MHSFGLNYRLPDVLAALEPKQLSKLEAFKFRRAGIKAKYDAFFSDMAGLRVPVQRVYTDPTWHLYPLRVEAGRRRSIFEGLRAAGVGVQVNYLPAYWHPVFAEGGYPRGLCELAEKFYSEEISLPMYATLGSGDQEDVLHSLRRSMMT